MQHLHCMHCHHPQSRRPLHPSTPASPAPPSSRSITRSPCPSSSRRPKPGSSPPLTLRPLPRHRVSAPPQLPASTLTTRRTHFTNEAIVATSPRAPTPRPRTCPPAPHGHPQFPPAFPALQSTPAAHPLAALPSLPPPTSGHSPTTFQHPRTNYIPAPRRPRPEPVEWGSQHSDQSPRTLRPW